MKPKQTKQLTEQEYQELFIKETKINIEGKFTQYINQVLFWESKSNWKLKDYRIESILELYKKMQSVLEGINNNTNIIV